MLDQLTTDDFSKNLNTKFQISSEEGNSTEAELVEVLELRNDEILNSFSIVFLVPTDFGAEQKIFKVEHPEMETMEMFLVPVRQTNEGYRYEGIFNRLIQK